MFIQMHNLETWIGFCIFLKLTILIWYQMLHLNFFCSIKCANCNYNCRALLQSRFGVVSEFLPEYFLLEGRIIITRIVYIMSLKLYLVKEKGTQKEVSKKSCFNNCILLDFYRKKRWKRRKMTHLGFLFVWFLFLHPLHLLL